ncbi:NADPH-dependent F420 reductase [Dactylosporangium siamense]|uniref:Oxidoreductase n=1 Tax=Dactylosporangium siamense TaxID=685454 RepID=A0A919UDF0_9ACTN|nr:NAD(P)-binding domain-containing protein [Dactylosporangium siamense]GIG46558.1 oxidoreductase [Dactylosporangium siamense]
MTDLNVGVLGTGAVGEAIATRLIEVGYDVVMGSRDAANPKAVAWAERTGGRAGTFADAAAHGSLLFNATPGGASLDVLRSAGDLTGKVLADISNDLTSAAVKPVAAGLQAAFPSLKVVKTLNTVNCDVMVRPDLLSQPHTMFVAGDDAVAKAQVRTVLTKFGWPEDDVLDLGGIDKAFAMEQYVPLWIAVWGAKRDLRFNLRVVS